MKRYSLIFLTVLSFWFVCTPLFSQDEWRRLARGPFVLACHEEDVRNGENVMSIVEEVYPRIAEDLGLLVMGKTTIVIASSEREFHVITGGQIPEWGVGAADPSRAILFLKSPGFSQPETNFRQVVVHELSHVMLGMAVEGRVVDRWFDEGFAQFESGERGLSGAVLLAKSLLGGQALRLDEIDEVLTFRRDKAALAYAESRAAVEYLVDTYGKDVIPRIVRVLGEGKGMDEVFLSNLGIGFQEFQMEWFRAMKHTYRWYILLDLPLVFSVILIVLLFTAFFITRRRIQQRRRIWEEEALYGIERLEEDSTPG